MYFTLGILRSAKRNEANWVSYASNKKFSDGFTEIAAQLLYPSNYQRLGFIIIIIIFLL